MENMREDGRVREGKAQQQAAADTEVTKGNR
jgi:hypothetical protein